MRCIDIHFGNTSKHYETYMASKIYLPLFVIFPPPPFFIFTQSFSLSVCCTLHSHFLTHTSIYHHHPHHSFRRSPSLSLLHAHTLTCLILSHISHTHTSLYFTPPLYLSIPVSISLYSLSHAEFSLSGILSFFPPTISLAFNLSLSRIHSTLSHTFSHPTMFFVFLSLSLCVICLQQTLFSHS